MKKLLFLAIAFILILLASNSCSNVDYGGKDTHKVYGNGVYAILNHSRDDKLIRSIHNRKYNQCIIDNIIAMEETDEFVYVYGEFTKLPVYAVIDIINNKVKLHAEVEDDDTLCITQLYNMIKAGDAIYLDNYEDFSEDERKILDKLKTSDSQN